MEERVDSIEKKTKITDKDLNALEAWGMGSSHPIIVGDEDTQEALERLFQTDRRSILTPRNLLDKAVSLADQDKVRTNSVYEDGNLVIFGPQYAFGYNHKAYFRGLAEDGTASQMEIEISKGSVPIDLTQLKISPQFLPFYEEPEISGNRVLLKYKK